MIKERLKGIVHLWQTGRINDTDFITAVEAYSSASNNGKPIVSGSLPSRKDFLKTMLDWHDEYYKAGRFNIPLGHEQSEYLSWLAYRLAKVWGSDR